MDEIRILQEHVRISDPHITSDDADRLSILGNIFDPLMRVRDDGTFSPCLADSWTLTEDARTWRFSIRDDVRFHDGSWLRMEDVVFSLRRIRDEDIPGELGTSGVIKGYLKGSEIDIEGKHVLVRTPEPMADLTDLLCEIPVLSERIGADSMVGTGAFRLVSADGERVVLESSNRRLVFEAEKGATKRLKAVRSGEADVASKLPPALEADGVRIARSTTSVCATFMFNFQTEAAKLRPLRKAINLAVDVDALIRGVMFGAADPLSGPLTKRHLGFDPEAKAWPFDASAARHILEEEKLTGTKILIDIPAILPDEAPALAKEIGRYLEKVGLEVEIRTDADRPGYAMRVRGKPKGDKAIGDMACFDSSPSSTFRVFWEKFHSGNAGPWWMGYRNERFDTLVDRGRQAVDLSSRRAVYQEAYGLLRDDAPWLFLYNPVRRTAIGNRLPNWNPSTGGLLLF
mgnify:CR=1 FL=1|jgi:peptide/nickel transport system substrate-binding protein